MNIGRYFPRSSPLHRYAALAVLISLGIFSSNAAAQRHFPPDSLENTQVIPRSTPVMNVVGTMRNFTSALGVRCQYCHVGTEGMSLDSFDFVSDKKRTKLVARQMMRMVSEINHRLDTIPERPASSVTVTCATCHRGVSRPTTLAQRLADSVQVGGAESAIRDYKALRAQYFGRDSYDFGELSLNVAAFRVARAGKPEDALQLLALNESFFPTSSGLSVFRGNVLLMKGDTTAAAASFREAIKRDAQNQEARGRLRDIGRQP
ncbi:MAG: c-type cytochrome [Gemmatimonadaceae bacterium]